jgi:hypothetical protein
MTTPCMIMAQGALRAWNVTTALTKMRAFRRLHRILTTQICFLVPLASHVALWVSSHAQVLPQTQLYMFICTAEKGSGLA